MQGRHQWRTISLTDRQLGRLEPETPGFAPPPRDELALLDINRDRRMPPGGLGLRDTTAAFVQVRAFIHCCLVAPDS